MAATSISDMQINIPYLLKYIQTETTARSAFVRSGIAAPNPAIASIVAAAGGSGKVVHLPFFDDLTGDDEVLSENALTPAAITSDQDIAAIHRRGKAFGASDLSAALTANDPVQAIADRIADYRVAKRQAVLFATLKGIFADGGALASTHVLDISGETGDAAVLGSTTLLDAAQLLGDAKDKLVGVAMHSAAETKLCKLAQNSQLYRPADQTPARLSSYAGRYVIVDDSCGYDPETGVAELYLFGAGAIALNDAQGNDPALETYREPLKSTSGLISRDNYIMHPRGVAWVGSPSGVAPTNIELGTAANWSKVYADKNIRICKLVCKLA